VGAGPPAPSCSSRQHATWKSREEREEKRREKREEKGREKREEKGRELPSALDVEEKRGEEKRSRLMRRGRCR
jgi:hypothetical protein